MDNWWEIRSSFERELMEVGFKRYSAYKCEGRIPQEGLVNGFYIEIEINYEKYPLGSPSIMLTSINGCTEIFKCVPKTWRHLDEHLVFNPADSVFHVCCLHNWSAQQCHNAKFVYSRLLSWLTANAEGVWPANDDLPTWRILPNCSEIMLFISKKFIEEIDEEGYFTGKIMHTPYKFKAGGTAVIKNLGNKYPLSDIDFSYEQTIWSKPYKYVVHSSHEEKSSANFAYKIFMNDFQESNALIIRIKNKLTFKSVYQLFEVTKQYDIVSLIDKKDKNIPIIYVYHGDRGRREVIALLIDVNSLKGSLERITYKVFQVQAIVEPEIPIPLNIALLGAGSLGSQIARILVDKGVKQLKISDTDTLTLTNLGFHELTAPSLGAFKAYHLAAYLTYRISHYFPTIEPVPNDASAIIDSDVVIVAVGSNASFDRLAFDVLGNITMPIIWCWVSEYNILQEIVITEGSNGCLNCYYLLCKNDTELCRLHRKAKEEIENYPKYQVDACGDPHVPSQWERTVFLASQIVTLLTFYAKHKRFPFEFITYYWPMNEIYPQIKTGYVDSQAACFCKR